MSYQVRHKKMGIFQGELWGIGFWHPMSEQPEQGLWEFSTQVEAGAFIAHCISQCVDNFTVEDFIIEPFDTKLDFEMQLVKIEES